MKTIRKKLPRSYLKNIISQGIQDERAAITYYEYLIPEIENGNDKRSLLHILNEEKDHLKILEKINNKP
ncbi:MAG: hypothetical protein PHW62_00610 [Candidatus Ratteibacteria bacterium]|nr:hypothetical protein [Candidatus Ratteibacteria bacterium]